MKPRILYLNIIALSLSFYSLPAISAALPGIDNALASCIGPEELAGAVTYVATKDRGIVHLQAHGYSDLASKTPMHPDSIFRIASMTKPITATAILILQDEGKLNIDDPISKYLPEFATSTPPPGKPAIITIKQLLSHTSGLDGLTKEQSDNTTLAGFAAAYAKLPMLNEPGEKWKYTRVGLNLAARIVEIVSDQPFDHFIEKRIFAPLGMNDTAYNQPPEKLPRIVSAYYKPEGSGTIVARKLSNKNALPSGSGGLTTTATDYGRFCRMLLNEGELDGVRILKTDTVRLMRTSATGSIKAGFSPGHTWGIGVGIVREPLPGKGTANLSPGSFGHVGAYGTHAWIDPVKGVVYILMIQRNDLPGAYDDTEIRKRFQQAASDALFVK